MIQLYIAAAAFLAIHLGVAGTRARDLLTGRLGEARYLGLFSLASLAGMVWLIAAFGWARGTAGDIDYWGPEGWRRHASLALAALAFLLAVPGLLTPGPTLVGAEATLDRPEPATGILRVTRHPFLWGVAAWALGHLISNGDTASLVFFGSFLVLGVAGPPSIDAKKARKLGDRWGPFAAKTSSLPFAAILQGRQRLDLGEIGWGKLALALILFGAIVALHPIAFHAYPLG